MPSYIEISGSTAAASGRGAGAPAGSGGAALTVAPIGSWRLANLVQVEAELRALDAEAFRAGAELTVATDFQKQEESGKAAPQGAARIVVDGSRLEELDTSGALLLLQFLSGKANGSAVTFSKLSERAAAILELTKASARPACDFAPRNVSLVERIGRSTVEIGQILNTLLGFVGETLVALMRTVLNPRSLRFKELTAQFEYVCIDAIPIVALVTFLIGIVITYLFGIQIEKYGANIFIVDGAALAISRELSPILVAIIVAGRSGSAFTAQIGTMKINEEIDAMTTLGLPPMTMLVVPRVLALMCAMPLLVFVGDVVGILGSMLIADLRLGVTGVTFLERLHVVLPVKSFFVGLGKAPVFAIFIAVIGCHLGLSVENNARSVGINTTSTVVRSIVAVILLNAGFAIVLSELKI